MPSRVKSCRATLRTPRRRRGKGDALGAAPSQTRGTVQQLRDPPRGEYSSALAPQYRTGRCLPRGHFLPCNDSDTLVWCPPNNVCLGSRTLALFVRRVRTVGWGARLRASLKVVKGPDCCCRVHSPNERGERHAIISLGRGDCGMNGNIIFRGRGMDSPLPPLLNNMLYRM